MNESKDSGHLVATGNFDRRRDGRWALRRGRDKCDLAEGLAAERPPLRARNEEFDPCLVCANWNARTGCVLAYKQNLDEFASNYAPLEKVLKQTKAWEEIGRFERAMEILTAYLNANPKDPWAYFSLAKLYDHPAYKGSDKKRCVVLYDRFIALRSHKQDDDPYLVYSKRRIALNRSRDTAALIADDRRASEMPLTSFSCFYRFGTLTHVVFGYITEKLIIWAQAGDADPASRLCSTEMGRRYEKATQFFRWVGGEESDKDREIELTRQEIKRLSALSPRALSLEKRQSVWEAHKNIQGVRLVRDTAQEARVLSFTTSNAIEMLIFPESQYNKAEQCAAVLRFLSERNQQSRSGRP